MIQIEDKILSSELLTEYFCCDPVQCQGRCCVEGDSGAPIEIHEADLLQAEYETYKPYLKPEGIAELENQGFMEVDADGDYTTPLINHAECAFSFQENGITLCAIERAYLRGECSVNKPISCHLYPIRLATFSNGTIGLNYHRWKICRSACRTGKTKGIPLYRCLKDAIIRRFGVSFFEALEEAERYLLLAANKK